MSETAEAETAVEVAAKAMYEANQTFHEELRAERAGGVFVSQTRPTWDEADDYHRDLYRMRTRAVLASLRAAVLEEAAVERLRESEWQSGYTAGYNDAVNGTRCGRRVAAATLIRSLAQPVTDEARDHDRLCKRQWANQIGVDHCDCSTRRPTTDEGSE